ncbi:MAG: hypothetical protein ABF646_06290 [Acetobacter papayae]
MKKFSITLSVATVLLFFFLSYQVYVPFQSDYSEGWNATRQIMVLNGVPLYSAPPHFMQTNYPPLWFHCIALLAELFGCNPDIMGRLVSLAALFSLAGLAMQLTCRVTGRQSAGVTAAALFLLLYALELPVRVAENDPQPLGMLLEMTGLLLALSSHDSKKSLYASAFFFALAVFFKPNLIGVPAGIGLALLANRNWKQFAIWSLLGVTGTALLYALTITIDGPYFMAHLFSPRTYSLHDAVYKDLRFTLIRNFPFIALSALWCWHSRVNTTKRLLGSVWLCTHLAAFYFTGGDGVAFNIFFECLWLDSILSVCALVTFPASWSAFTPTAFRLSIAACALVLLIRFPVGLVSSAIQWHQSATNSASYLNATALLRGIKGDVVCENLLMCVDAGKISLFDPYFLRGQIKKGLYPQDMMEKLLALPTTQAIEIGDTSNPVNPKYRYDRIPAKVYTWLTAHYKLAYQTPTVAIWVRHASTKEGP